jgi:hypothetical protein
MGRAMAKIFILGGAGATGKLVAKHLLERSDVAVTLAGRNLEKARMLAGELDRQFPGRVAAVRADAADGEALKSALAGHDLMVVTAPATAHAATVISAALDTGTDYLDVQLGAKKFALLREHEAEIAAAGRCFITEAGFHPGLPSALMRFAAAHLDRLDRAVTAGFLNMGRDLPYTEAFDELIEVFVDFQAQVYRDGAWTKPGAYEFRKVDFGGDIGVKRCVSMFFEELRDMPRLFPSLRETGFYISDSHWMTDYVVTPLIMLWLKLAPRRVRSCGWLMWWTMHTFHKPPYRVELQVQAEGVHAGQPTRFAAAVSHPDGYELTAIPVAAALLQYLDGSARRPGLWLMGHFAEPGRLMDDMKRMGVKLNIAIG